MSQQFPTVSSSDYSAFSDQTAEQLSRLGFAAHQIRKVKENFEDETSLLHILSRGLPPLDAAIEYLMLSLPESDLPSRFLPSQNSSAPFITSIHSGHEDLKLRRIGEQAQQAGFRSVRFGV